MGGIAAAGGSLVMAAQVYGKQLLSCSAGADKDLLFLCLSIQL